VPPYNLTLKDGTRIEGIPASIDKNSAELKAWYQAKRAAGAGEVIRYDGPGAAPAAAPASPSAAAPAAAPPAAAPAAPESAAQAAEAGMAAASLPAPSTLVGDIPGTDPAGMLAAIGRGAGPTLLGATVGGGLSALAGPEAIPAGMVMGAGVSNAVFGLGDIVVGGVNEILGTKYTAPTDALNDLLTRLGVPEPDTEAERIAEAVTRGGGAALGDIGIGKILMQFGSPAVRWASQNAGKLMSSAANLWERIGRTMIENPASQLAGGAAASAAAQAAQEAGLGPIPSTLAGMAGGIIGSRFGGGPAELARPGQQKMPTPEQASKEVGALVKQASKPGLGRSAARQKVIALAEINPEARRMAERLGFELPADVFADNPQVRAAAGLARSLAGSDLEGAWKASMANALDQADDVMRQLDATFAEGNVAPAVVSERVKDAVTKTREALSKEAADLYAEIEAAVPKQTPVKLSKLEQTLAEIASEVGDDGLSSQEKALRKMLDQNPTYGRLLREKNLIGQALARKESPYGNMEAASLKRLYGALAEDQIANVDAAGAAVRGETFYHGTTAKEFGKFRSGLTYLTSDKAEAQGFADSPLLAGHFEAGGGEPRAVEITAKPGKVKNIGPAIDDAIMEGVDPDEVIEGMRPELTKEGVRYVEFSHPSTSGGEDMTVRVSLYPDEDLAVASVGAPASSGLGEKLRAANLAYGKAKELGDRIVDMYGADVDGSISSKMKSAIVSASKGDGQAFNRLLDFVPEDLRRETVATSLASVARNRKGEFGFAEYAQTYKGLRANPPVYARLVKELGEGADQTLRGLYVVSKYITDARAQVLTTGKANQALLEGMGAAKVESLVGKIFRSMVLRTGATAAGAAVGGPPGAALAGVMTSALTDAKPSALQAAGRMFASKEFQRLAEAAATGKMPNLEQIRSVAVSTPFQHFARAVKLPGATTQRELWILAALQSTGEE
jgi:hypothetical protein